MTRVHIEAPFLHGTPIALIGDGLAQVPFLRHLGKIQVTGLFNRHILPLIEGLPIDFKPGLGSSVGADFVIGAQRSRDACQARGFTPHMAQGHFICNGLEPPALPIDVDLKSSPCRMPPGIVISPFSVSDIGQNKIWPHERWVHVVQALRKLGLAQEAYVVGSHPGDSTEHYAVAGITPFFDRPLTHVLDLMRKSPLVMTLDNGIGHLAHFGGISRHVMIYADCLPPKFAEAPRAIHVRGPQPLAIYADQVLHAAREVLQR